MDQASDELIREVVGWDGVSDHPHRFGGREFRLGTAEIGHVHSGGVVDIPFPIALRDSLIAAGHAERHHWLPDSGWTTVRLSRQGRAAAVQLLRVSYLRGLAKQQPGLAPSPSREGELAELWTKLVGRPPGNAVESESRESL